MQFPIRFSALLAALVVVASAEAAILPRFCQLDRLNRRLHGRIVDHTRNHGRDHRIWSKALGEKRDLYVYLPPNYDPSKKYPLLMVLHGFNQDETSFLTEVIEPLDRAIAQGKLPPCIVAAPDGSCHGLQLLALEGTFFLNSRMGAYEDYIVQDVFGFLCDNYPLRPEPEARVLFGISMGGGAAYNFGFKYRDRFRVVVGLFPPLNVRWISCRGRYMDNFDPCCQALREDFTNPREVLGRFYGVITIRMKRVVYPLYGRDNDVLVARTSEVNPIEMLTAYNIKPGDLEMYIAYGGKDQFNIDAQVESFLAKAKERNLEIGVAYDPNGKHDARTALGLLPGILDWLKPRLAPYAP